MGCQVGLSAIRLLAVGKANDRSFIFPLADSLYFPLRCILELCFDLLNPRQPAGRISGLIDILPGGFPRMEFCSLTSLSEESIDFGLQCHSDIKFGIAAFAVSADRQQVLGFL